MKLDLGCPVSEEMASAFYGIRAAQQRMIGNAAYLKSALGHQQEPSITAALARIWADMVRLEMEVEAVESLVDSCGANIKQFWEAIRGARDWLPAAEFDRKVQELLQ